MPRDFNDYPVDQLEIVLMVDREWTKSKLPHPLIACDFDQNDDLYVVSLVGSAVSAGLKAVAAWYEAHEAPDDEKLLARLSEIPK